MYRVLIRSEGAQTVGNVDAWYGMDGVMLTVPVGGIDVTDSRTPGDASCDLSADLVSCVIPVPKAECPALLESR
jgi:hypothetical protein